MTNIEYNELVDCLYRGHDFLFSYKNQEFFLERFDTTHGLYKRATEDAFDFVREINGENLIVRINAFLEMPFLDGKSFNDLYSTIDVWEIE